MSEQARLDLTVTEVRQETALIRAIRLARAARRAAAVLGGRRAH